jgi:hypothetical protein
MAALCDIFVNDAFGTAHRAEGTTYGIAQFAPSPAPARCWRPRSTPSPRPWPPEAPAGGHRRRLQGQHQAHHPAKPGRQGRSADRRRRHRQHLHAGRRACPSARAWPNPIWWTRPRP